MTVSQISFLHSVVVQGSRDDLISTGSTDSRRISTAIERDHGEFRTTVTAPIHMSSGLDLFLFTDHPLSSPQRQNLCYTQLGPLAALYLKAVAVCQTCATQSVLYIVVDLFLGIEHHIHHSTYPRLALL